MDKILKAVTALVLITVVALLVAVLAIIFTMPDLPSAEQNDNICLPSVDGALTCGPTPDKLKEYLKQQLSIKYEEKKADAKRKQQENLDKNRIRLASIYDKSYWEMKPAAKLTGKELSKRNKSDADSDMTPVGEWNNGRELYDTHGFERYGIRYRNGRLVVPVGGTYFIYSFVDFYETCDSVMGKPNVEDAKEPIKHGLYRFNILEDEEIELVTNVQPHVISGNKYFNSYNSYISTLTDLKAGDEISVKVSNIKYLKYVDYNYFGLNLV